MKLSSRRDLLLYFAFTDYAYRNGLTCRDRQKYPKIKMLATAAYAHHNDVNAYRRTAITASSAIRFANPNNTMGRTREKNSVPHVATI